MLISILSETYYLLTNGCYIGSFVPRKIQCTRAKPWPRSCSSRLHSTASGVIGLINPFWVFLLWWHVLSNWVILRNLRNTTYLWVDDNVSHIKTCIFTPVEGHSNTLLLLSLPHFRSLAVFYCGVINRWTKDVLLFLFKIPSGPSR